MPATQEPHKEVLGYWGWPFVQRDNSGLVYPATIGEIQEHGLKFGDLLVLPREEIALEK